MSIKSKCISLHFFLTLILVQVVLGCSAKHKENSDAKQIYQKPIPVRVKIIEPRKFEQYISFYSKLTGRIETTKTSMISDRIDKIFVKAGEFVKRGQIVLQFPTDNPSLQFQQAKVNYENTSKIYNRFKELLKSGETSQQNFDNVETQYLVAKRNYEALKQIIFVEAPISGYVSALYVTEGQQIDIGKPLFTISVLDRVHAIAWANEKEIQNLKLGMPGKIIWLGKEYPCKIVSLAMKMDDYMKGFRVEFEAVNPKFELKSGVTVEIKIKIYENPNSITIPSVLIDKDLNGKNFVFVEENGIAIKQYVEVGRISGTEVEILNGLNFGDRLIVEGNHLVEDSSKVVVMN
ncbi:MAG: efflux RND transporter periplasmic adaptor subunit [Candidatus Kapaibacteriota bacterium]